MSNSKKIIIPSGYMGSGSSVITDIMSEIEGVDVSRGTFEYVFMHCPNGLFDLEDKLLIGNNAVRSDEALHSFEDTMKQLYDKKYWWVGHYNENIGADFYKETLEFTKSITDLESDYYWYYQENTNAKMFVKLCVNKFLKLVTLGKFKPKKVLTYSPMRVSFANSERFYSNAKQYIYRLFNMAGYDKSSILFDQLLLPFNLFRFENYFDDDAFVFVIERDPRDVFISNKYYWSKNNEPVPYPTDVKDFCKYYRSLREMEKPANHKNICRIKFEDLIYNYDSSISAIFNLLGWDEASHTLRKTKFVPERSINNTQLFRKNEKYAEECEYIAQELKEYLYDFPYELNHETNEVF
ncbi:MAG: sulfotransferase domain-containing protein [Clostridia bacterium]|nr:sulfotransferase domain-containing protein [Clostridia bacterium]